MTMNDLKKYKLLLESIENGEMLFELTDKVKNQMVEKFKDEEPTLNDAQIEYYLNKWDQYVNSFEPKFRDITKLSFKQVERLIDDAVTKSELKGKGEIKTFDQSDDIIYDKNNLTILRGDIREKCIKYGDGYSWCISRKDASNMFYSYRMRQNEPVFYFVFDKDRPTSDVWHAVVIYVDNRNIFHVATANNPGDVQMSWEQIEQKHPKLRGLRSLFKSQPLTDEEKSDYKKFKNSVGNNTYKEFTLKEKYKYIRFGHKLTDTQQNDTPKELIGVYAKLMPIYITAETWDRLNSSDKRKVEEGRLEAVKRNWELIQHIPNPSKDVQMTAVQNDGYAIEYIKNPDKDVQMAAVQQDGRLIRYIDNPDKDVQMAAVQQDVRAIEYIDNPDKDLQMTAVQRNGYAIRHIDNPDKDIQMAAVQQIGISIKYIKNPDKDVQMAAVQSRGYVIGYINNPDKDLQMAAVQQDGFLIQSIKNPDKDVQMAAVQQDGTAIIYFENPDKDVQMAAVQNDGDALRYIKNPHPDVVEYVRNNQ
jgi:hypothetical protein